MSFSEGLDSMVQALSTPFWEFHYTNEVFEQTVDLDAFLLPFGSFRFVCYLRFS